MLPIGYWDGYSRAFSNKAFVFVRGQKVPVIGIVSMNMLTVDVTQVPDICVHDEVELISKNITTDELEELTGVKNLEIVTKINPRIPRIITG